MDEPRLLRRKVLFPRVITASVGPEAKEKRPLKERSRGRSGGQRGEEGRSLPPLSLCACCVGVSSWT